MDANLDQSAVLELQELPKGIGNRELENSDIAVGDWPSTPLKGKSSASLQETESETESSTERQLH